MTEIASRARTGRSFHCRIPLVVLAGFFVITASTSCSGSRELTRSRADNLVRESGDFRRPITIPVTGKREQPTQARSLNESEEVARERAIDDYARAHVEIAAFRHLGLIDLRATLIEGPTTAHEWWRFSVESVLTEKGEGEAVDESEDKGRKGIIISRREMIEVTGVTAPKEGAAQAEFTWKDIPTPAGEAFDPASDAYRGLPDWLRQGIAGPPAGLGRSLERRYDSVRKGKALFQLYDDGWRVQSIHF